MLQLIFACKLFYDAVSNAEGKWDVKTIMNGELVRIWNVSVVAYLNALYKYWAGELEENKNATY